MRKLFLVGILLILTIVYLNRSYAYFYNFFGSRPLPNPNFKNYQIGNKAASEVFKYVALGDSLTAGIGVISPEQTLPYLVAKSLPKQNIILNNLGAPQSTTLTVLNSQINPALSVNPDLVTIFIGMNDLHNLQNPENFKTNYQQIISKLRAKSQAKIVLITLPYLGSPKTLLPPYNFLMDWRTQQFNEVIKKLGEKSDLQIIDLYTPTKNQMQKDISMYSFDGFHPSEKGYKLWSEIINSELKAF